MAENLTAIVLAAGKGTRMKSPLPKVLHPAAGRPILERVIKAMQGAGASGVRVIIGHGGTLVKAFVEPMGAKTFEQKEQLGTGHAVKCADIESLEGDVVIMAGDHPLIRPADVKQFVEEFRGNKLDLAVVTCVLKKPGAFGRIVRHGGRLRAIVEAKDASAETLKIREVNTGIYVIKAELLRELLPKIKNHNANKEYYLTDVISLAIEQNYSVDALTTNPRVALGVNTQEELARATRFLYRDKARNLMEAGVVILDPHSVYIEEKVKVGEGSVLYPGVFLRGTTEVGKFSVVEPNCFLSDSYVGDSVQIKAGSYVEKTIIHSKASVGPYARLRPETEIGEEAHVGNFVEMKKTKFGKKSKAGHLTYLGDAEIGEEVNIGCGTITCNYAADRQKYKTVIGDRSFVGSDTQFIAPITIGADTVIGSGSTITKDVPDRALAVARGKQIIREDYVPVGKKEE